MGGGGHLGFLQLLTQLFIGLLPLADGAAGLFNLSCLLIPHSLCLICPDLYIWNYLHKRRPINAVLCSLGLYQHRSWMSFTLLLPDTSQGTNLN